MLMFYGKAILTENYSLSLNNHIKVSQIDVL